MSDEPTITGQLIKYGLNGVPELRNFTISSDNKLLQWMGKRGAEDFVSLSDLKDIWLGQKSEFLRTLPNHLAIVTFSLVCNDTTLDLVARSIEDRRRWIAAIQTAHAAVAPDASAAITQSLAQQGEPGEVLETASKARLAAMFLDLVSPAKAHAPRRSSTTTYPADLTSSHQLLSDGSAASTASGPDLHLDPHLRAKRSSIASAGLSLHAHAAADEVVTATATAQDAQSITRLRAKTISPALLSNPLFAKKSNLSNFNHFGRAASLMEYALEHEPAAADMLLAEMQALEACVRKVPNFASVSSEQMQHTVQNAERKTCEAGQLLLQEGDLSGSMLYVYAGSVAVSSASKGFIAHIYQDNIVGHHSYIYRRPRTATVHASKEDNASLIYYEFTFADTMQPTDSLASHTRAASVTSQAAPDSAAISLLPDLSSQLLSKAADVSNSAPYLPSPAAAASSPTFPSNHAKRSSLPSMISMPSIDEASRPKVSKIINSRRSVAELGNVPESFSSQVVVAEGDVKAELKQADDIATLNRICSSEIDDLHTHLFALKLQQKQLQTSVAALIAPALHVASLPALEAQLSLRAMLMHSPHLTGSTLHETCLTRALAEMKIVLAQADKHVAGQ